VISAQMSRSQQQMVVSLSVLVASKGQGVIVRRAMYTRWAYSCRRPCHKWKRSALVQNLSGPSQTWCSRLVSGSPATLLDNDDPEYKQCDDAIIKSTFLNNVDSQILNSSRLNSNVTLVKFYKKYLYIDLF